VVIAGRAAKAGVDPATHSVNPTHFSDGCAGQDARARSGVRAAAQNDDHRGNPVKDRRGRLRFFRLLTIVACLAALPGAHGDAGHAAEAPTPLVQKGSPVDWWFVFKFNAASFPGCGGQQKRVCTFGGTPQNYRSGFGQQFVYASSRNPALQKGSGCAGATVADPVGATFEQVYGGSLYYVIWNDQFYGDPKIAGCGTSCSSPWGHSKGMVAWNEDGQGFVLQVSTPSWPAAGNKNFPRNSDGNTLGCVKDDDVEVSQHFFALKLTKDDVVAVLKALQNASVVTDPGNRQIVNNGGPADIRTLVGALGTKSTSTALTRDTLSSGAVLISKPSRLNVPPWQMVSAVLNGTPLRTATWWANPKIYSTTKDSAIACWNDALGKPGPVKIATSGHWETTTFGLIGGDGPNFNHAKIGVSTSGPHHYTVFGDMNQQGALSGKCASSQNGRGGLFYVLQEPTLFEGVTTLIDGDTAPTQAPAGAAGR
jgi:hypothetical protein